MTKLLISAAIFFMLIFGLAPLAFAENVNATADDPLQELPEAAPNATNVTNATEAAENNGEAEATQVSMYVPEFREDGSYDFRKTRWGMGPDEVEAAEGKKPTRNDTNSKSGVYRIGYKDVDLFGVEIWLVYSFVNNKLWGAGYAKDYAKEEDFDVIAAKALAYYGDTQLFTEGNTREYEWAQGEDTQVILRHIDDPRRGHRIFFNFTCASLSPDPVNRRGMFTP